MAPQLQQPGCSKKQFCGFSRVLQVLKPPFLHLGVVSRLKPRTTERGAVRFAIIGCDVGLGAKVGRIRFSNRAQAGVPVPLKSDAKRGWEPRSEGLRHSNGAQASFSRAACLRGTVPLEQKAHNENGVVVATRAREKN